MSAYDANAITLTFSKQSGLNGRTHAHTELNEAKNKGQIRPYNRFSEFTQKTKVEHVADVLDNESLEACALHQPITRYSPWALSP